MPPFGGGASIGSHTLDENTPDHQVAMANADAAMYQIKAGAPAVGSRTSRDPLGYLTKT